MYNRKFAIGAWIFSILLTLVLVTIIATFYARNFEPGAAIPYYCALGFLATVSIWLTKYHDEPNEPFTKASFTCKCVLILIMCLNAAFCFSLGRQMSVAHKLTDEQRKQETEYYQKISELQKDSGPKAKLELAKAMSAHKPVDVSAESNVFKENEMTAFVLMVSEFLSGAAVVMIMMGLMIFGAKAIATAQPLQISQPIQATRGNAGISQPATVGPLVYHPANLTQYPPVFQNARGQGGPCFRFKTNGRGYQVSWRHNGSELTCGKYSPPEIAVMATLKYKELARKIVEDRRNKNPQDTTADQIETTI